MVETRLLRMQIVMELGAVMLSQVVFRNPDNPLQTFFMPKTAWEDAGKPTTITVDIKMGDKLNVH